MRTIRVDERKFLSIIGKCEDIERLAVDVQINGNNGYLERMASYCWEIQLWQAPDECFLSQTIEITSLDASAIDGACSKIMRYARDLEQTGAQYHLKAIKKCCSKIVDIVLIAAKKEYGKADQSPPAEQGKEGE